jgi:NitT/TauT family transport system substrate-binding protein
MPRPLALLLLAACTGEPEVPGATKLRVAYIPIADCAQLYVAGEQQLWEKHGLAVETTPLAGGSKTLEALASGAVDVAYASVVSLAQARASGLPFVTVGGAVVEDAEHAAHRLLVPATSAVAGPADLAGKQVALATFRGVDQLVLLEYVAAAGLTADAVRLREVPFPRMEGVLQSGEVDAALAMEPYVSLATKNGTAKAVDNPYTRVAARTLVATYVMKADAAAGPAGKAVAAVLAEATAWIDAHDAETRALVATKTSLDPAVATAMPMNRVEAAVKREDLQAILDRATRAGFLEKAPTADELLPR